MGKKYIIEIGRLERLYKAFVGAHGKPSLTWLSPEVDMTPYTEPDLGTLAEENFERGYRQRKAEEEKEIQGAYQRGLADAWDAARKIVLPGDVSGIYLADLEEIFDRSSLQDVIKDYSASECIKKIRQYEEKEEQITKGDVIRIKSTPEIEILVTYVDEEYVSGIALTEVDDNCEIGDQYTNIRICNVEKTGEHYEIAEVLAKMKETDNG